MYDENQRKPATGIGENLILAVLLAFALAAMARGQCIDATLELQLADVPGVVACQVQHAYPWEPAKAAEILSHKGKLVLVDYEPEVIQRVDWHRELDPKFGTLAHIAETHRANYRFLDGLAADAKKAGTRPGSYGWLSLIYRRSGDIIFDHARWRNDVRTVCALPCYQGKTFRELLIKLDGHEWGPLYLPGEWNNDGFGRDFFLLFCERVAAAMEAEGVPFIPLFQPLDTNGKPVRDSIVRASVVWARGRYGDRWAVWAKPGSVTPAYKELLK